jgi:hypothetical protein
MTAVHGLSLDCMSRAAHADTMDKRDAFVTQATKLSRTFTAQVEALTKLRSGGKQQVEVRYVYVDARGGQNIIASALGGGGQEENGRQPREPGDIARLPFAPGVPVWGEEQGGVGMSGASDAGKEAVPAARGQKPGCAEGQGQRQLQARPADAGTAGREAHDPRAGRPGEEHPQ